jgi:hypothetical protein
MPVPATTGQLRTKISEMEIGDYISWRSDGNYYYMDNDITGTERPILGETVGKLPYANSYWYGIKVAKGLIIADRVIEHSVSWDSLNSSRLIQGIKLLLNKFTNVIDYQTTYQGRSLSSENEYIARTNNSNWQGANVILRTPESEIIASGVVEIEYDALLTGFYSSAPNHFMSLTEATKPINRAGNDYGINEYTTSTIHLSFNTSQPSLNVWHKFKHVIDFTTKECKTYVDGVLTVVPNYRFLTVTDGTKLNFQIGVGTYRYSANNSYKNLTIKQGTNEPKSIKFGEKEGLMRVPTGGVAYTDENGHKLLTNKNLGGFPINNEWDKYITNFPKELILEGKSLDDVFHHTRDVKNTAGVYTWCQETPVSEIGVSVNRIIRSRYIENTGVITESILGNIVSNTSANYIGFRPVFEYKE